MRNSMTNTLRSLNPLRGLRRLAHSLRNGWRRRHSGLEGIVFTLPADMPALPEARGWLRRRILGDPPLSLAELDEHFERIAADPRTRIVVLHLRGLNLALADLQTLRASVQRLRQRGRRVVCYAQDYDNATYYVAAACDEIVLQPGGSLQALGLVARPTFLKHTLDSLGVQLDVVAITPFKGALDSFSRETISPEGRQQLDWLLDSRYEMLLAGIAEGRGIALEAARALIDGGPYTAQAALAAGHVSALLNEEALPAHLGVERLVPWQEAAPRLFQRWRPSAAGGCVAVLPLAGLIIPGESAEPPSGLPVPLPILDDGRLGDLTVVRQARGLLRSKHVKAVVLWIDSGGGSAAASEAMAAALGELARDRPLVAYLNAVAASGGYYIATPAQWIVAQPGTITGSIGVILAKAVTRGLFERLGANRLEFTRGANAGLFSDGAPFTDAQRAIMRQGIEETYRLFVARVAASRRLTPEAVDAVGGGRVWTGQQALGHGLVDELGDLKAAVAKARALAGLPETAPVYLVQGRGQPLGPQARQAADPAAGLRHAAAAFRALTSGAALFLLPFRWE